MAKGNRVNRPLKKSEYGIVFASREAQKGWTDLLSQMRGPLVETWDFLTRTPTEVTPRNYRLKGELGTVERNGVRYERWQHKPTIKGDARIWFYIDKQTVYLERVTTAHPNETK